MTIKTVLIAPNHSLIHANDRIHLEKAEADLALALAAKGFRVGIAAFRESRDNSSLGGHLCGNGIRLHYLNFLRSHHRPMSKLINYLICFIKTPFVLRQYEGAYLFFPGHVPSIIGFWTILLKKPYGLYVRCYWRKNSKSSRFQETILSHARFMIVTGTAFLKMLSVYPAKKVNEVPLTFFHPDRTVKPARRVTPRFIYVGRICESKGVFDAVKAMSEVKNVHPEARLLIAGGGTDEDLSSLKALVTQRDLGAQVAILGQLAPEALAEMYGEAFAMVFPSYYQEGFPRVLYEAMMFSLPIITCPMPGTEDFLMEGRHCLYSPAQNPSALAEKMLKLLADQAEAMTMGNNNFTTVSALYKGFQHTSHVEQLAGFLDDENAISAGYDTPSSPRQQA